MRYERAIPLLAGLMIGACEAPPLSPAASGLADKVHTLATERATGYGPIGFGKALSACIQWPQQTGTDPKVEFTHYTYTEIGTDGQLPPSQLREGTLQACQGIAARHDLDCTCQIVDVNGKNTVEPRGAASHLNADQLAAAKALDRQYYTISLDGDDVAASLAKALSAYQSDWQMPVTGRLTPDLLDHIRRDHPDREATWMAVESGACKVFNPWPAARETVHWTGGCTDGMASESGTLTYRYMRENTWLEEVYTGELRNGEFDGRGKIVYATGSSYDGMFRNGKREGVGTFNYRNGTRYQGEWRHGERDGQGKMRWANGATYEGS